MSPDLLTDELKWALGIYLIGPERTTRKAVRQRAHGSASVGAREWDKPCGANEVSLLLLFQQPVD